MIDNRIGKTIDRITKTKILINKKINRKFNGMSIARYVDTLTDRKTSREITKWTEKVREK